MSSLIEQQESSQSLQQDQPSPTTAQPSFSLNLPHRLPNGHPPRSSYFSHPIIEYILPKLYTSIFDKLLKIEVCNWYLLLEEMASKNDLSFFEALLDEFIPSHPQLIIDFTQIFHPNRDQHSILRHLINTAPDIYYLIVQSPYITFDFDHLDHLVEDQGTSMSDFLLHLPPSLFISMYKRYYEKFYLNYKQIDNINRLTMMNLLNGLLSTQNYNNTDYMLKKKPGLIPLFTEWITTHWKKTDTIRPFTLYVINSIHKIPLPEKLISSVLLSPYSNDIFLQLQPTNAPIVEWFFHITEFDKDLNINAADGYNTGQSIGSAVNAKQRLQQRWLDLNTHDLLNHIKYINSLPNISITVTIEQLFDALGHTNTTLTMDTIEYLFKYNNPSLTKLLDYTDISDDGVSSKLLDHAIRTCQIDIAKFLIQYGAKITTKQNTICKIINSIRAHPLVYDEEVGLCCLSKTYLNSDEYLERCNQGFDFYLKQLLTQLTEPCQSNHYHNNIDDDDNDVDFNSTRLNSKDTSELNQNPTIISTDTNQHNGNATRDTDISDISGDIVAHVKNDSKSTFTSGELKTLYKYLNPPESTVLLPPESTTLAKIIESVVYMQKMIRYGANPLQKLRKYKKSTIICIYVTAKHDFPSIKDDVVLYDICEGLCQVLLDGSEFEWMKTHVQNFALKPNKQFQ